MGNKLTEMIEKIVENRMRRAIALTLAVVVTFTTTYALILPAVTLEKDTAETMSGVSLGENGQKGDVSTVSEKEEAAKEEKRRQREIQIRKEQEERRKRQEELERIRKEEEAKRLEQERVKAEKRRKMLLGILAAAVVVGAACCYIFVVGPMLQYNKGKKLLSDEKYSEAKVVFSGLGDYKDSAELEIKAEAENILDQADSLYLAGDLDAAYNLYAQLNSNSFSEDYRKTGRDKQNDIRYKQAAAFIEDGNYSEALGIYVTLGYFKDSDDLRIETEYKLAEQ